MNLANRSFRNNLTGEVVTVLDSFEDIAILENKQRANVNQLLNTNLYTEENINMNIDPTTFFNNQGAYNILADKIKNIPSDQIRDEHGGISVNLDGNPYSTSVQPSINESSIYTTTVEDEMEEIARKYSVNTNNDSMIRQHDAFARILGEDADDLPPVQRYEEQQVIQRVDIQRNEQGDVYNTTEHFEQPKIHHVQVEDPIIKMFKGVKRSVPFNVSIDIENKIPRADFIEMMEDSYETSIIDFLAEEFTNNILRNPDMIKDMVKDKINCIVYGDDYKQKLEENERINEIVETLPKEKTTRKTTKKVEKVEETDVVEKPKRGRAKKVEIKE